MSSTPSPHLPKSKIPAWERRKTAERWKWNGRRQGDPGLPTLETRLDARPVRILLWSLAGGLAGITILFFALR